MKIPTLILALFSLLLQGGGQTVVIPIQNASFEQLPTDFYPSGPQNCGPIGYGHVQGWSYQWVFQPLNPNPCGIAPPPSGVTVAYTAYGGTLSQTLSVTPAGMQEYAPGYTHEGVYVLTFWVANYFPTYPGYFTAKVSFGAQELCETSGWGTQIFNQVTAICPSPGYIIVDKSLDEDGNSGPVQGHNNFVITFKSGGWPVLFDDVSLTFTPN